MRKKWLWIFISMTAFAGVAAQAATLTCKIQPTESLQYNAQLRPALFKYQNKENLLIDGYFRYANWSLRADVSSKKLSIYMDTRTSISKLDLLANPAVSPGNFNPKNGQDPRVFRKFYWDNYETFADTRVTGARLVSADGQLKIILHQVGPVATSYSGYIGNGVRVGPGTQMVDWVSIFACQ